MTAKTAEDRLRYVRSFSHVLRTGDAQSLLQLSPDKRIHAMKALSCLARFTGCQDTWRQIRQRYGLTWTTGTEKLDAFMRFFDDSKSLDKMLQWLREAISQLPAQYSRFLLFCALTGLRASETVNCISLIKADLHSYYNEDRQCLEHFRFANLFIRRTKAAYISLVDKSIIEIAQSIDKIPTLNSLKMASRNRCLSMQLKYCRKIFASWLRQSGGIEAEIVDLLQGRVPKSVFTRHYFTPDASYQSRVLSALNGLKTKIEQT